jgi:hypothetical protein
MAFLIADNRLTENSSWDERMLGEQLKILSELELDFDLEAIGFEVPEIVSSSMGSTQCPRPILMIACQMPRGLRPPFPVIYGSWPSTASFVATPCSQPTTAALWMARKPIL